MLNYYDFIKAHPELYKQFSCKELLFLICECPPDFTKSEDWAEHNCFLYVMNGEHIMHGRERSWILQQGHTIFLKKGGVGVERLDHNTFCSLMFYVPDSYIRSFTRENAALFPNNDLSTTSIDRVLTIETDKVLHAFYDSVLSYLTSGTQFPEHLLELKFKELLLNIIINPANRELAAYFYKLSTPGTDDLQEIMERNCLYGLQLHEYARLCHRSLSSFKRDFYTTYRTPPGRWLLEKRLETARRLLEASDKPVADVALESGFKNNAHFSRAFKNHFQISPLQCRKQVTAMETVYS